MKIPVRLLFSFLVFALLLAGCAGDTVTDEAAEGEGEVGEVEEVDLGLADEGTIVVGSDIAFEPFEFMQDGEPAGFDIDLMNEIADRLGVETEFVNTSFDTIFTQLAAGEFDAIISAITITDERKETIDFSDPYFAADQALAVAADSEIASVSDLAGAQVGVQAGTTGLDYAQEHFTDAQIVEFPTSEAAFTALEAGQIDAVFIDLPVVAERAETSEAVEQAEVVQTGELYGIGIQKGNDALREAINETLAEIIEDGTYAEIYSRWFEGEVPEQFAG